MTYTLCSSITQRCMDTPENRCSLVQGLFRAKNFTGFYLSQVLRHPKLGKEKLDYCYYHPLKCWILVKWSRNASRSNTRHRCWCRGRAPPARAQYIFICTIKRCMIEKHFVVLGNRILLFTTFGVFDNKNYWRVDLYWWEGTTVYCGRKNISMFVIKGYVQDGISWL
jgi:hypothetical protein